MLPILRTVAGNIKRAEACGMLAELVTPKIVIRPALTDPEAVHPIQQIELAEWLKKCANVRSMIRRNGSAAWRTCGRVWTREWIVLTREVAVLRKGAIAEVRPKTVKGPLVSRQQLAFRFKPSVGIPELSG